MTLQEVDKYMRTGETVYYVGGFMFQYHVFPARIEGISMLSFDWAPEIKLYNTALGKTERVSLCAIYANENEAAKECEKSQKEMGHVIITQKEYDELIALKDSMRDEAHGH